MTVTNEHKVLHLTDHLEPRLKLFVEPAAWAALWRSLDVAEPDWSVYAELMGRYAEQHRRYHNLQHLAECLEVRDRLGRSTEAPAEVDLALWFHDAIYEPAARDNEARSAEWLDRIASAAGIDAAIRKRLNALILATRHNASPLSFAESTLVDADLSILGAASARFDEYCLQIRAEYRYVPNFLYRRKRCQVLQGFCDRDRIYTTKGFYEHLEVQARENLARAIDALS